MCFLPTTDSHSIKELNVNSLFSKKKKTLGNKLQKPVKVEYLKWIQIENFK